MADRAYLERSDYLIMVAAPGEQVADFADGMLFRASIYDVAILGEFNEYTFEARPGMTVEQVMQPWIDGERKKA